MTIVYIEENARRARGKMHEVLYSLVSPTIVARKTSRSITLVSGIEMRFITKKEIDRIRGLNLAAVFVNCEFEFSIKEFIASQVRKK